jgi:tetratricopeptide (TPR) repeat protein
MLGRLYRAERLFSLGQKLAAQERVEAALRAFEQALALRPRAVGISLHWALALSEAGRLSEAQEVLQQAMTLQPTNPVLPMFLGQIFFDHAKYSMARMWCDRAQALNPYNSHTIALQALIDMALGHIPQGYRGLIQPLPLPVTALERVLLRCGRRDHPPSVLQQANTALQSRLLVVVETYLLHHGTQARTLSQQLAATSEVSEASVRARSIMGAIDRFCTHVVMGTKRLYTRVRYAGNAASRERRLLHATAEEAYYLGDSHTALACYTSLLKQMPECAELHQRLFEISYEQGDFRRALKHLRATLGQGVASDTLDAWQSLYLGELLYHAGRFSEAAACLARAASLRLHDYKLYYYLGLCRLRDGASREARRQFARAVQILNPGICSVRLDEVWRVYQRSQGASQKHNPPPPSVIPLADQEAT